MRTVTCAELGSVVVRGDRAARAAGTETMVRALRERGRYVVIGFASGDIPSLPRNEPPASAPRALDDLLNRRITGKAALIP